MRIVKPNNSCKNNEIVVGMIDEFHDCICKQNHQNMQTKSANIVIVENGKNIALFRATIQNLNTKKYTTSNEKGEFTISGNDSDRIEFRHLGMETLVMPFSSIPKVVVMTESVEELAPVTVTAPKSGVTVSESANAKEYKARKWLFWGSLAFIAGLFLVRRDDEKEDKK